MRTYYIYKATNLINGKVYVGQTVDFKQRVWQHLRCYEKEDCFFHQAIEKYGRNNFDFQIIDKTTNPIKATELENYYIEELKAYRPYGYNTNLYGMCGFGGRPIVQLTLSGKYVARYSSSGYAEKTKGFSNTSILYCCKDKQKSHKGFMFMFEDDYLKNGAKKYIKPKAHNKKKVIQCDLKGNYISEFDSLQEASIKTGVRRTSISCCVAHSYKSAGGYIFVYADEFPIKDVNLYVHSKKGTKVAQVDISTNEIINIYDSIAEAGRQLNVNYKSIHKVVDEENRSAYGYRWKSIC